MNIWTKLQQNLKSFRSALLTPPPKPTGTHRYFASYVPSPYSGEEKDTSITFTMWSRTSDGYKVKWKQSMFKNNFWHSQRAQVRAQVVFAHYRRLLLVISYKFIHPQNTLHDRAILCCTFERQISSRTPTLGLNFQRQIPRFDTANTIDRHWDRSWASSIHSHFHNPPP